MIVAKPKISNSEIGRGKKNFKSNICFLRISIGCLRKRNWSLSWLPILTSSLSPSACFLCGMGITSCRLGCLTLIICTMMSLPSTSLWFHYPWHLSWACWTPHYHDKTQQICFWTFFFLHEVRFKWFHFYYTLYLCRSVELNHVEPSFVHESFRIQWNRIIPLE
jgi:hypothetical protein